jgi:hypothetical protein
MTGKDPSFGSNGFHQLLFTIDEVTDGYAYGTDNFNRNLKIPMNIQRAKGVLPAAGEQWLLTKDLGPWTFAAITQYVGTTDNTQLPHYVSPGAGISLTDTSTEGILINEEGTGGVLIVGWGGNGVTITGGGANIVLNTSGSEGNIELYSNGGDISLDAPGGGITIGGTSNPGAGGGITIGGTGNKIGFFAHAVANRPTVSGSRGSNAALTSLLTGLANLGLIVNSSTT